MYIMCLKDFPCVCIFCQEELWKNLKFCQNQPHYKSCPLKCHYDKIHIFPIYAILKHKLVVCMRRILFTIFKYLLLFQRCSRFQNMQISQVMMS